MLNGTIFDIMTQKWGIGAPLFFVVFYLVSCTLRVLCGELLSSH
jgi:hypothetical protein